MQPTFKQKSTEGPCFDGLPKRVMNIIMDFCHTSMLLLQVTNRQFYWAGGAEGVLEELIHSFDEDPSALLAAFAPLRMPALLRRSLLIALQAAVKVRQAALI